jgi:hypothetical protein
LNPDFLDMLSALNAAGAEYPLVGAYAMAAHGHPRATADIDFWVRPSPDNAARVMQALKHFRAPLVGLKEADLATDNLIFQIGLPPRRIDIITGIDGVRFEEAWPAKVITHFSSEPCYIISREHLLQNKRACARVKDGWDVQLLERLPQTHPPDAKQSWEEGSSET